MWTEIGIQGECMERKKAETRFRPLKVKEVQNHIRVCGREAQNNFSPTVSEETKLADTYSN